MMSPDNLFHAQRFHLIRSFFTDARALRDLLCSAYFELLFLNRAISEAYVMPE